MSFCKIIGFTKRIYHFYKLIGFTKQIYEYKSLSPNHVPTNGNPAFGRKKAVGSNIWCCPFLRILGVSDLYVFVGRCDIRKSTLVAQGVL